MAQAQMNSFLAEFKILAARSGYELDTILKKAEELLLQWFDTEIRGERKVLLNPPPPTRASAFSSVAYRLGWSKASVKGVALELTLKWLKAEERLGNLHLRPPPSLPSPPAPKKPWYVYD